MPRISTVRFFTSRRGAVAGLALLAAGALGLVFLAGGDAPAQAAAGNPWDAPVPVRTVVAEAGDMAVRLQAIGTVTPLATVTVRSRVDGQLLRVAFDEGQTVASGQLLAEVDPAPYRIRLAQAEGRRLQTGAQLKNAERELARHRAMFAEEAVARQQVEALEAQVEQLRGTLMADRAQVDDARLQLAWTRIEAPIAGRLGLRLADPGKLLTAADTEGLATITQTRPISVLFALPEHRLGELRAAVRAGEPLTVEARDRDDRRVLASGRLSALDNLIDPATGTLKMKAEFANDDEALFPNQFVNVRVHVRTERGAITIPADAVQHGARGSYVYVIEDGKARIRPVALGVGDGARVAVAEGLRGGEQVVLEGLDRLREGREVVPAGEGEAAAVAPAPAQAAGG